MRFARWARNSTPKRRKKRYAKVAKGNRHRVEGNRVYLSKIGKTWENEDPTSCQMDILKDGRGVIRSQKDQLLDDDEIVRTKRVRALV